MVIRNARKHCLFVRKIFCKGYFRRGLTQGDEIWQGGRSANAEGTSANAEEPCEHTVS